MYKVDLNPVIPEGPPEPKDDCIARLSSRSAKSHATVSNVEELACGRMVMNRLTHISR